MMQRLKMDLVWWVMVLAVGLLMGCSGDDVSVPAERPSSEIHGSSLIKNGNVTVYAYNGLTDGLKGTALATANTIDTGAFTLELKANNTPILVCISQGQYLEMARNQTVSMGVNDELCAVENYSTGQALDIAVNVYTHLAYGLSMSLITGGTAVSSAVNLANQRVDALFGLDMNRIPAIDISSASSQTAFATDRHIVGFANAAVSQTMINIANANNSTDISLYNSIMFSSMAFNDVVADGLLNGKGAGGQALSFGNSVVDVETYRHNLVLDLYASVNADYNKTGLPGKAIKQMADALNNSTDAMFGDRPILALDSTPTITSTTDTTIQYKGNAEFSFTVADPYSIDHVTITFKGVPLTYSVLNGVYTVLIDTNQYPDGVYALEVSATNIYGSTSVSTNNIEAFNTPPSFLSGTVYDGLIFDGNLKVKDFSGGVIGVEMASAITDFEGKYGPLEILAHTRPLYTDITAGRYIEEASGKNVPLKTTTTNHKMRAVSIHEPGQEFTLNVTTWTNIATGIAEYNISQGLDASVAVRNANFLVDSYLGFSILSTEPVDITNVNNAGQISNGVEYGFLAGGLSQYTYNLSKNIDSVPHDHINSINFSVMAYDDARADGVLNGIGLNGQITFAGKPVNANTYRHGIGLGIIQMAYNPYNQTGLTAIDLLPLAKRINDSGSKIFEETPIIPLDEGGPMVTSFQPNDTVYNSGEIVVSATVTDLLGVIQVELLINDVSHGFPDVLLNPSFTINTTLMDDCYCTFTLRITNIEGTTVDSIYKVQIDNRRFFYSRYMQQTSPYTDSYGIFSYSADGSTVIFDRNITTGTSVASEPIQLFHPSKNIVYVDDLSKRYSLDVITGLPINPVIMRTNGSSPYIKVKQTIMSKDEHWAVQSTNVTTVGTIGSKNQLQLFSIDEISGDTSLVGPAEMLPNISSVKIAFHPNSKILFVLSSNLKQMYVYNVTNTGLLADSTKTISLVGSYDFLLDPNGLYLYVLDFTLSTIYKYQIGPTGTLIFGDQYAVNEPYSAAISNGRFYVTSSTNVTVSVFDIGQFGELTELFYSPYPIPDVLKYTNTELYVDGDDRLFLVPDRGLYSAKITSNGISTFNVLLPGYSFKETPPGTTRIPTFTIRGAANATQ